MLLLAASLTGRAADSGRQVVVVYNSRMPESKSVAEYYARRRDVPPGQVLGFDLSTSEEISRTEFRDTLQRPLARALEKKKLWHVGSEFLEATNGQAPKVVWKVQWSKIRYAVLCYGVPLRIAEDPGWVDAVVNTNIPPPMRRNGAAVDSELSLLPMLDNHLPLTGPIRNVFYSITNTAALDPTNGILMVSRLDGPSAAIARGLVDKAIQAETDGLWGRAYFDLRGTTDPNYKLGDLWIGGAAEICGHLGFETIIDTNESTFPADFPMSQIAIYCGWYSANVSGPFAQKTVEFMPGAFAYHLHSYSAATIRSTTSNWVGPLLAKGATITMGSVAEPFLVGTPNVAIFCSRLIFSGFSFGEAAYASQTMLSWQTTVVGDPLYRPFGGSPEKLQLALEKKHSPLLAWSILRLVNLNLAQGRPLAQMSDFLEQQPLTARSAVLTQKLGDLYEAEGKPSSALAEYEAALKLDPSPEQRIGLRLTLGKKYLAADRVADAVANYRKLLQESPEYPGRSAIEQKVKSLEEKLARPGGPREPSAGSGSRASRTVTPEPGIPIPD